jgi:DNA topoisomerase VI subunit A
VFLGDINVYALDIFASYAYGSQGCVDEAKELSCPTLVFLGPFLDDLKDENMTMFKQIGVELENVPYIKFQKNNV